MNYLLEMIDYLIDFDQMLDVCVDEWDKQKLYQGLMFFRRTGRLPDIYMPSQLIPIFRLLLHELKLQIAEAEPDWFDAFPAEGAEGAGDAAATAGGPQAPARAVTDEARIVDRFLDALAEEGDGGGDADLQHA